jgi:hypothetical protein
MSEKEYMDIEYDSRRRRKGKDPVGKKKKKKGS